MGSVIDMIECPNCQQEAYSDFYYKTGEEYISCFGCGYRYSASIKDREKPIDDDNNWEVEEIRHPFGAYVIKMKNTLGHQYGSIATRADYEKLKEQLEKQDTSDIESYVINRYVYGAFETEVLIDNK